MRVELLVANTLVGSMIDRFGKDVLLYLIDDSRVCFCVDVQASRTFFGWIAQFGDEAKIEKPRMLADEFCEFIQKTLSGYKE